MKTIILAVALVLTACTTPQRLNLSAEEQQICDAEDGCTVITKRLYDYLMKVHEWALEQQGRERRGRGA